MLYDYRRQLFLSGLGSGPDLGSESVSLPVGGNTASMKTFLSRLERLPSAQPMDFVVLVLIFVRVAFQDLTMSSEREFLRIG
jgi:hypothetical protein